MFVCLGLLLKEENVGWRSIIQLIFIDGYFVSRLAVNNANSIYNTQVGCSCDSNELVSGLIYLNSLSAHSPVTRHIQRKQIIPAKSIKIEVYKRGQEVFIPALFYFNIRGHVRIINRCFESHEYNLKRIYAGLTDSQNTCMNNCLFYWIFSSPFETQKTLVFLF